MKYAIYTWILVPLRPSPHGEGGLKSALLLHGGGGFTSLPAWGGWIEIKMPVGAPLLIRGPSPHGEGGLKWMAASRFALKSRPSPHGEGGLKLQGKDGEKCICKSLPAWGGGIKIQSILAKSSSSAACPPEWAAVWRSSLRETLSWQTRW